jgi:hypothetical protein
MEIFSFILLGVLALAMTLISIFFVVLFSKNMRQGREFRKNLANALQQLRMHKVLAALGLDSNVYLHKVSVQVIQQQMSKCKNCNTTDTCDEKLSRKTVQQADIAFCPIHENLFQVSTLTHKAA